MRILIDEYKTEEVKDRIFGTCDICMSTADDVDEYFVVHVEGEDKRYLVPLFYWCYGDKFEIFIENVPDFCAWLAERDVEFDGDLGNRGDSYTLFSDLAEEYACRE